MTKLYLPTKQIEVEYGGRTRIVIIPSTGDPIWDRDLEQSAREKTMDELKKLPPILKQTQEKKKEVGGILKEFVEFKKREKEGTKRFF